MVLRSRIHIHEGSWIDLDQPLLLHGTGVLGSSSTPIYSSGSSSTPIYSPGSSSTPIYSRNAECSNCKHLLDKITVLEATVDMYIASGTTHSNSSALYSRVATMVMILVCLLASYIANLQLPQVRSYEAVMGHYISKDHEGIPAQLQTLFSPPKAAPRMLYSCRTTTSMLKTFVRASLNVYRSTFASCWTGSLEVFNSFLDKLLPARVSFCKFSPTLVVKRVEPTVPSSNLDSLNTKQSEPLRTRGLQVAKVCFGGSG
ncbi:hypothetical protein Tco_0012852 [Tanacetum coccineum]